MMIRIDPMRLFRSSVLLLLPVLLGCLLLVPDLALGQERPALLKTLVPGHPRLIATDGDIERLRSLIATNAEAKQIHEGLIREAEQTLERPLVEYKIVGPRLLTQSRNCMDRVYLFGLLYRIDPTKTVYLERAKAELRAAAAFPDWNPSHFLDTAEMSHAFAIGYDWLYHDLSPEERTLIKTSLIEKGLQVYTDYIDNKKAWWHRCNHNWNQVTNGGCGVGALALADEEPSLCAKVLELAINAIQIPLKEYEPDGGWSEGPGYWNYATRYTVYFLAALQSALQNDFNLPEFPGLAVTGLFPIHATSPTGLTFNYADGGTRVRNNPVNFWLGHEYKQPVYAWPTQDYLRQPDPLDLVWYSAEKQSPGQAQIPLDKHYRGIDVVFLRSAWDDPNAIFLGMKGGDNNANHSHLDLGSFVLDALGQRWAVDLGGDDYNLPGYFGKQRWTYVCLINEGHNTLTLDGKNQDPKAVAPIPRFESTPDWAFAITDLSQAYKESAQSVQRGFAMIERKHVLVQDEIACAQAAEILWGMLTPATVEASGKIAFLELNGQKIQATILSPEACSFTLEDLQIPEPQRQRPGIRRLAIRLQAKETRLAVLFTPILPESPIAAWSGEIKPLNNW
ncbi:MAG: heparinase II/III family protein [bacterium]|jgi:hypothetical protein|nr:heparinase II/III family protein [bacterium]